jgi:hypothetical protein
VVVVAADVEVVASEVVVVGAVVVVLTGVLVVVVDVVSEPAPSPQAADTNVTPAKRIRRRRLNSVPFVRVWIAPFWRKESLDASILTTTEVGALFTAGS